MKLRDYFEQNEGVGIFSSASSTGKVAAAIYSTPHFIEDNTVAFIMRDRLTHANVQENPYACYLFHQRGSRSEGVRLYLKKVRESEDQDVIAKLSRRPAISKDSEEYGEKFLVYFEVEKILPLLGDDEIDLHLF